MTTASILYTGDLRTEATHVQSGSTFLTDAPTDNQGKGEYFSPTDLLATSLGACVITTMGIFAKGQGYDLTGTQVDVTKVMASAPRRVAEVHVKLHMQGTKAFTDEMKASLERVGHACPVAKSLAPEVVQAIEYVWPEA